MTAEPKRRPKGLTFAAIFLAGALIGGLSTVQIVPNFTGLAVDPATGEVLDVAGTTTDVSTSSDGASGNAGGVAGGAGASDGGGGSGAASTGDGALPPARAGLECAPGKNGGETDQGVTGDAVKMATTVAESGPGASFLGQVRFAMEAVRERINRAGGICGRQLEIQYVDDGWNPQTGSQYLRNFIQEGIFAIPVAPSSEGLRVVIDSGDIDAAQIPVVGTDGMLEDQYTKPDGSAQPWVWPVAAATVSSARVMAQEAYKRGARDFSIVFEKNYRFGVEGAKAFNDYVRKLTGKSVAGYNTENSCQQNYCGINGGNSNYGGDAANFEEGDFVALFMEPTTALNWMRDPNVKAAKDVKYGYGAAQPLFTRGFANSCGAKCHGMQVWTGFRPPIESYANDPAVKEYVQELKRTKPDADEFNAFTEGGYVGMLLLESALKRVGPDLTRARLKAALDSTCLDTGLLIKGKLCYSPSNRYANIYMQGFQIQYSGTFAGWRSGPILRDPGV
ncbi:MAG: ABC transporter substrate-binding protein [Actinomycetota bacterium]